MRTPNLLIPEKRFTLPTDEPKIVPALVIGCGLLTLGSILLALMWVWNQ